MIDKFLSSISLYKSIVIKELQRVRVQNILFVFILITFCWIWVYLSRHHLSELKYILQRCFFILFLYLYDMSCFILYTIFYLIYLSNEDNRCDKELEISRKYMQEVGKDNLFHRDSALFKKKEHTAYQDFIEAVNKFKLNSDFFSRRSFYELCK